MLNATKMVHTFGTQYFSTQKPVLGLELAESLTLATYPELGTEN